MYKVKRMLKKIKYYIIDKWHWLLTFNNPPKVTINQDVIGYKDGPPAIELHGRVVLEVNGDVILK